MIVDSGYIGANAQREFQQEYSAKTFGSQGDGPGEFFEPWAIAINDYCVFVADRKDNQGTRFRTINYI